MMIAVIVVKWKMSLGEAGEIIKNEDMLQKANYNIGLCFFKHCCNVDVACRILF